MTALVWFRRDLRLTDNPAWASATTDHRGVEAIFVLDRRLFGPAGGPRRDLLLGHLHALDGELRQRGGRLTFAAGSPEEVIPVAARSHEAVYWNRDHSPFATRRDQAVTDAMAADVHTFDGGLVHAPESVLANSGAPYRAFTPYFRRWSSLPAAPELHAGDARILSSATSEIPLPGRPVMTAGEAGAHRRLASFLDVIDGYEEHRDRPGLDRTSHLSADLKFGTIGPRQVLRSALAEESPGRRAFVRQLAWRDFYTQLLHHHPHTVSRPFRTELGSLEWSDDTESATAWQEGRTGFPIVDAGMRQLRDEGWMHNRVRLITASFLVKDLGIDWRVGERHFRRLLVDADVAQNVGNWQWVAGTGADAAPYFRIMNPIRQSVRFDPDGTYIRRHVPELAKLSSPAVHSPWEHPLETSAAGIVLGTDYPHPLVDHSVARLETLARFESARG
jgi:deoxyribodipyrimidine photo-lyase